MKYLYLSVLFLCSMALKSQNPEIVKGTLLLRTAKDADLIKIVDDNRYLNGIASGLRPAR